MAQYIRPTSAKTKYNMGSMLRTAIDQCEFIRMPSPSAAALPAVSGVIQEYTAVQKDAPTIVCGGTIEAINDVYGVLFEDTVPATADSLYVRKAKAILMQIAAVTPAVGELAYIVPGTRLVTNVALGNVLIGSFNKVKETNPAGLPAGDYCEVNLDN